MLHTPTSERQFIMYEAIRKGRNQCRELFELTKIKTLLHPESDEGTGKRGGEALQYKGEVPPVEFSCQAKLDGLRR